MKPLARILLTLASMALASANLRASVVASFDDMPAPPAVTSSSGLSFTNGGSSVYKGATWGSGFSVVGDQYRVDSLSGPLFGIPHSGHYYVTNQNGESGLMITTDKVLTGAWFGRNQYYGFSEGGADQVSIFALAGAVELASVVFDLSDSHPGQPEPLAFLDTSAFSALSGITGYRIDRRELGQQAGHWVADDFQFNDASNRIPEPGTLALLLAGLAYPLIRARRQAQKRG